MIMCLKTLSKAKEYESLIQDYRINRGNEEINISYANLVDLSKPSDHWRIMMREASKFLIWVPGLSCC